jgi:hypothetical protein
MWSFGQKPLDKKRVPPPPTRCFARVQSDPSFSRKVFSLPSLLDRQGEREGDG